MSDGYTPTMEQVRTFWASDGKLQPAAKSYKFAESAAEFDRAVAAHDWELREKIARDIEARGRAAAARYRESDLADGVWDGIGTTSPNECEWVQWSNTFARIARGEG